MPIPPPWFNSSIAYAPFAQRSMCVSQIDHNLSFVLLKNGIPSHPEKINNQLLIGGSFKSWELC